MPDKKRQRRSKRAIGFSPFGLAKEADLPLSAVQKAIALREIEVVYFAGRPRILPDEAERVKKLAAAE